MTNTKLKDITEILEYCRWLNSKITTVLIEEGLPHKDFELNMRILAFNIVNEQIRLQVTINNLADDAIKRGK